MRAWLHNLAAQLDLAGVLLVVMIVAMIWTLVLAQRAEGFDLKTVLLDDGGKVSFLRVSGLGAFGFSSWTLMKDTLTADGVDPTVFLIYVAAWSSAPVVGKALEVWRAKQ